MCTNATAVAVIPTLEPGVLLLTRVFPEVLVAPWDVKVEEENWLLAKTILVVKPPIVVEAPLAIIETATALDGMFIPVLDHVLFEALVSPASLGQKGAIVLTSIHLMELPDHCRTNPV